jgi:hypothetical protein
MDTTTHNHLIEQIGNTAGEVWRHLTENGPTTMAKLVKAVDEPRDLVMQALGWLAREDKLSIEEDGRTRVVSLKS